MRRIMLGRRPILALGATALAAPAIAQARPITLVVPFPPGGSTDLMGRLLAERMQAVLGQPVLAGGEPARRGDGRRCGVRGAGGAGRLHRHGQFRHDADAEPAADAPAVLQARGFRAGLAALDPALRLPAPEPAAGGSITAGTRRPGEVGQAGQFDSGTNGPSSFNNIAAVLVADRLGIRMQDVTYKGDAQQLNDFMAGTLDLLVVGGASAIQPHRNGQGRILAWTGDRRMPITPDIPTFAEIRARPWRRPISAWPSRRRRRARRSTACRRRRRPRCGTPGFRDRLLAEGQFALGTGPEEYGAFLKAEAARWAPVLQKMNLQID